MLQFYLRDAGLALSWVGSGRLIFSLDFTDAQFDDVVRRFVAACTAMQRDGWWWHAPQGTSVQRRRAMRWELLKEMVRHRLNRG